MPCTKNTDGSWSCQGGGYAVNIAADGAIQVQEGDSLSKYSMAIEGNFNHIGDFKHRRHQTDGQIRTSDLRTIDNVDYIMTGETLYHMPTHNAWRLGFTPTPILNPNPISVPSVLAKVAHRPRIVCMLPKLFALRKDPQNRWKANFNKRQNAEGKASHLVRVLGPYKDANADLVFQEFQKSATNVLDKIEEPWANNDLDQFVERLIHWDDQVAQEVGSLGVYNFKGNILVGSERGAYIHYWQTRMIRDRTTLMSCYEMEYSPGGLN